MMRNRLDLYLLVALDSFLEAVREDGRRKAVGALETSLERDLAQQFLAQRDEFMGEYDGGSAGHGTADWEDAFTAAAAATAPGFTKALTDAIGDGLLFGAKQLLADLGPEISIALKFDLKNPRAVAYLAEHGAELVKGIDETTRDYLRTVITDGVRDGLSYDELARQIIDRYGEFAVGSPLQHIDSRAHLIAVTESGMAYVEGNAIIARDLQDDGLPMEKSWLTVGDGRVDEEDCLPNEGQGWIPFDDAFQSGHMQPLAHPG